MMGYDEIDDPRKVRYLKGYVTVLDKFCKEINKCLDNSKPMSKGTLMDWLKKIGKAGSFSKSNYNDIMNYFTNYYNMLDDNDKLGILAIILDEIVNEMYVIEMVYIPNLLTE
jgi:hypothetical protein